MVDNTAANRSISSTGQAADGLAGKMATGFGKVGTVFSNIGDKLTSFGTSMTANVTAPIVAVGTAATKMAMDTEESMAKVQSILGISGAEWNKYQQDLKQGANELGMAYSDYADAAYSAISASVEQGKVTGFLTEANKLAKGGMSDLSTTTDILTTAINAYGLSADDASHISDVLINTQNKGKTTVAELASSMGKIIPTAKAQNVSLEQLGAGYQILTAKGIATAEATTYYNSMLNELGKGGTQVDKILREVAGGSFAELEASGKSVGDVLQILKDYADANGKSFSDLWSSSEAGKAALVLLSDGAEEFNNALSGMNDCVGVANSAFETMNGTAKEQLNQAINEMKNAFSDLGTAMTPIVAQVAEVVKEFANWASSMIQTHPQFVEMATKVALVVAAIGPLISVVGMVSSGIGTLCGIVSSVAGFFTAGATGISGFSAVLAALTGPIGIAVAAITGIIATLVLLYNKNEEVRNAINQCWEAVKQCFSAACEAIKGIINAFVASFNQIWQKYGTDIKEIASAAWKLVGDVFKGAFDFIKDVFNIFKDAFKGDWKAVWEDVKKLASDVWNNIGKALGDWLDLMVKAIVNIGHAMFEAGKSIFTKLWDGIKSIWNSIKSWINQVKHDPVKAITGIGSALFSAGKSIFTKLWEGIKSVWSGIQSWVGEKVEWIKDKVTFWNNSNNSMNKSSVKSHAGGINSVPYDNYFTVLHKGERVLTASENNALNSKDTSFSSAPQINIVMNYPQVSSKADIKTISRQLKEQISQGDRALGLV